MRKLALVKWLMLGLGGLVVLTATAGFIYQKSQEAADLERYPPPGKLFDVQGTKMHIHCTGEGSPTVVFEMGLSETSSRWTDIHDKVSATTRVCSYDRAGLGYSEPVGRPIPSKEVASRLRTLLQKAGIDDKLILVGYSAGGIHIRQFYQQDAERVAGMVFVESTHEQQGTRLPPWPEPPFMARFYPYLFHIAYFRFFGATESDYAWLKLEEKALGRTMTAEDFAHYGSAAAAEVEAFLADVSKNAEPVQLGDLPITVLTRAKPVELSPMMSESITLEYLLEEQRGWKELQTEIVALSTNSRQIMAEKSDHMIWLHEPELIVSSIEQMVSELRQQARTQR